VSPTNGKLCRLDFVEIVYRASSIPSSHNPLRPARSGDGCERQIARRRCGRRLAGIALFHPKTSQVAPTGSAPAMSAARRSLQGRHFARANAASLFVMLAIFGWMLDTPHKMRAEAPAIQVQTIMGDRT
jgi:hypothetical protein